jgi:hypothetical protein
MLETARELAAALASAHAKGITHRDLKPENVMRAGDGRLKVLDFGLAHVDDAFDRTGGRPSPGHATRPGMLVGTPAYMAPEQLNGQPADPRSDVFSLGVLLYEYASGAHPFQGGTPLAVVARILESDAQPIEALRPDVPAPLASVVERCVRKDPAERWSSGVDVALALARSEGALPSRGGLMTAWWRIHQLIIMAVYCGATFLAWQIKERVHGLADPAFVAVGIAAALNGVLRGHLLFTERMNRPAMSAERARAEPITLAVDLAMAAMLAVCGALVMPGRPLAAMLTIALASGIALARTVLEPATAAAVFDGRA